MRRIGCSGSHLVPATVAATSGSLRATTVPDVGVLHHGELWVEDLDVAERAWGWLLGRRGYTAEDRSGHGCAWMRGPTYLFLESGPPGSVDGTTGCGPA
jgi:hypothetical protein